MSNAVNNARAGRIDGLYSAWLVAIAVQRGTDVAASIATVLTGDIAIWRNSLAYPFNEDILLSYPAWVWTK